MEWNNLISRCSSRAGFADSLGSIEAVYDKIGSSGAELNRSMFQRDYDRIIFSSAFRRLAGKTQVFPLADEKFHNRLTHSLEVASVGRSLGTKTGFLVLEREGHLKSKDDIPEMASPDSSPVNPYEMGASVSAACLAHDIGNPPFGHAGEKAFSEFFKSDRGRAITDLLNSRQRTELENFNGNAMGFRLLTNTKSLISSREGGFNLSMTTLGAFMKYPWNLHHAPKDKFGVFLIDNPKYHKIIRSLGMIKQAEQPLDDTLSPLNHRHPLSLLSDAADEICYTCIDLEDACRNSIVSYDHACEHLENLAADSNEDYRPRDKMKIHDKRARISWLRSRAIGNLIDQSVRSFDENYEAIMDGSFDKALCDINHASKLMHEAADFSFREIYGHEQVIKLELAGFQVIGGLLYVFLNAALGLDQRIKKSQIDRFYKLIPEQYILGADKKPIEDKYELILNVCEFVSGMTDKYAVKLYRIFNGIDFE